MPAEPPDRRGDDPVSGASEDELTFAVQDLGRERAPERHSPDLGFVSTRQAPSPSPHAAPTPAAPAVPAPAQAHDGFVIREAGTAPVAAVDALVVGAPEVTEAEDPASLDAASVGFRISSATAAPPAPANELWITRTPAAGSAAGAPATPSRRGWSTRQSDAVDRSAHATMLRLREEAVNVSWKAAWIAVTAANPRLLRTRRSTEGPSAL